MGQFNRPSYDGPIIGSVDALASVLGLKSTEELESICDSADRFYRPGKTVEKNGKKRKTIKAVGKLRRVQGRIRGRILSHVRYPDYLLGGIKDLESPKDYVANAEHHAGSRVVISQDVKNFYPSLGAKQLQRIWQHFFGFHPAVARCLTKLTQRNDQLPQGAVTSNYLSNLAFFDLEPEVVADLAGLSIRYTRYIDDITISADHYLSSELLASSISTIIGMMYKWELQPKRAKQHILSAAGRMTVHGLNVNRTKPTMNRESRSLLRNRVHKLEQIALVDRMSLSYEKEYTSLSGIVGTMKRFHSDEAASLRERLREIRPVPSDKRIAELRRQVLRCIRTPLTDRQGRGFSRRLGQVSSAVGMIRHARPKEADRLLARLSTVRKSIP